MSEDKIAELAIQIWKADDAGEIVKEIRSFGLECWVDDGAIRIRNPSLNFTVSILTRNDPINNAVCLAMAFAWMYWPKIYTNLLQKVNKAWKAQDAKS